MRAATFSHDPTKEEVREHGATAAERDCAVSDDDRLNPERRGSAFTPTIDRTVPIVRATGEGTRFGTESKCV